MKEEIIRVLSIEDNMADETLLQDKLFEAQRVGWDLPRFEVKHVAHLRGALDLLRSERFDVVLSDLDLPDSRAGETVATLREHIPHMPIVVLTGREDEVLAHKSVRAGVQDYLYKTEATGSLLARAMMYAIERQQVQDKLGRLVDDRTVELREEIAERKRAEQELRESEARFRALSEQAAMPIMVLQDGALRYFNEAFVQASRYSREELRTFSPYQFMETIHPEDRDKMLRSIRGKESGEEAVSHYEYRGIRRDGQTGWFELYSHSIQYDGRPAIMVTFQDITERKRAEEGLRESQQWFSTTLRSIGDAVIATDGEGKVRLLNPVAEKLTGWSEAEAMGKPLGEVFYIVSEQTGERVENPIDRVLREGVIVGLGNHTALIARDGTQLSIADSAAPIEDQSGAIIGAILVFRDVTERKRVERELARRHWLWDALMENTPDLVYFKDDQHRMIQASRAYADVLGLDLEDVIGKTAIELWPEEGEEIIADERRVLEGEPLTGKEREVTNPSGESLWYLLTKIPIYEDGKLIGFFAIDKEITERKLAEERLAFRSMLLDQIEDKITATDLEGRITYVNEAECRGFGKTKDELIGQNVEQYGDDPERGATQQEIIEVTLTEGRWRGEVVNIAEDGREIILDSRTQLVYDENGEPVGMLGISTDITKRKRAENALRESERQKELILNSTAEMIAYYDTDLRVIWANRASAESVGKSPEELVGRHCYEIWPQLEEPCPGCPVLKARDEKAPQRCEQQTPDGRYWSLRGYPVFDEEGEVIALVEFGQDITVRKRAEEKLELYAAELERSNRDLEQFGYVVSHDLQAPLRAVKSYLQLLADRYEGQLDARADKYIGSAVDGAEHMQEMIRALLDLSRVGTRGEEFSPTDCESVLGHVLDGLSLNIEGSEADVTHDPLPTVMVDEAQLAQVFQNLIANAIKFRREDEPPRVHISASLSLQGGEGRDEAEWLFSVADNGIGIDPEQAERIFQVFQRLHTEEEYPGLGIGLALCKRIVERHGGRIWVESKPEEGSAFYFTLLA